MADRIVKFASISWVDEDGETHMAFRRQTVDTDTIPERDLDRFVTLGAFMPEGAEEEDVPTIGEYTEFSSDMSDAELQVWVAGANVQTVVTAADENPDEAERILEAEYAAAAEADREPRKGIEKGVEAALGSQG